MAGADGFNGRLYRAESLEAYMLKLTSFPIAAHPHICFIGQFFF